MADKNEFMCYNCGKKFRDGANLQRHKNRKTPCLIREVVPEQQNNPNRCIYCNKVFANIGNRNKHLKSCKIKNGGMDILVDKVKHEQEIRILKEQFELERRAKDERIQKLEEKLTEHINTVSGKQPVQQVVNNVNNVNNVNYNAPVQINNIVINNYTTPNIDNLRITADEITTVSKLSKFLLQKLFFNPELPQNHCLYLKNKKDKSLIVFADNQWNIVLGENINDVVRKLNDTVYVNGSTLLTGAEGPYAGDDKKYLALPGGDQEKIRQFNIGCDMLSQDDAYEVFLGGRDIVLSTIKAAGCKLI